MIPLAMRRTLLFAVLLAGLLALGPDTALAVCGNPVACENEKTDQRVPADQWEAGLGNPALAGFATRMSSTPGQTVSFKVKATTAYHVDILRLGYYGGAGARRWAANLPGTQSAQTACLMPEASSGLIDCGNWTVSAQWTIPANAVSGVYIARLVPTGGGSASIIPFVVRDDSRKADVLLQTSDSTWAAYNTYGGNSLYQCQTAPCPGGSPDAYKGADKVSYNKPFTTAGIEGPVLFYSEYPMIRFLEANGYDLSYASSFDVHDQPAQVLGHRMFVSSGHDEYWSAGQRSNVEAARDAGVNLAFFGGNDIFWKTRWASSADGSGSPGRTLIAYKDTHYNEIRDPEAWTGSWRDPRFSPPKDGGRPENELMGQMFIVNIGTATIQVPGRYAPLRMWRNTAVAALQPNQNLPLATNSLGYEWDADFDNEWRPAGLFGMSSTTVDAPNVFIDYGSVEDPRTVTHNLTMYKRGKARVFSAGTMNWSRGLDDFRGLDTNPVETPVNAAMRQMTVNVFADMGVQPTTPIAGIAAASASTDGVAPSSAVATPAAGATIADGTTTTISGTASDAGGVVAGVEVSTDGGTTWHAASGTTNWSYTWTAHGAPRTRIRTRAVDDSGNIETPGAGRQVTITCPCSLLASATPDVVDGQDSEAVELGVRFRTDRAGEITGIRFYKSAANTGTHTGSLWSAAGGRLAQVTFTGESASGWQSATFSQPVKVVPGQTYVASYHAPNGHYSSSPFAWYAVTPAPAAPPGRDSYPLRAVRSTVDTPNGVFTYSGTSAFPVNTFRGTNYWVDVLFTADPITEPPDPGPGDPGPGPADPGPTPTTPTTPTPAPEPAKKKANTVRAALRSASVRRSKKTGARSLRVVVRAEEAVAVRTTLKAGRKTLVSKIRLKVKGTRTLTFTLPRTTKAGKVSLQLSLRDAEDKTKSYKRTLKVPAALSPSRSRGR